jgi:cobalt-zinc-cadmium efflux system outer membrane protein
VIRPLAAVLLLAGCTAAPPGPDPLPDRPATAARPAAPPDLIEALDLDRALALAERRHPDLAQSRARAEAAEGLAVQSGLAPNPSLVGRMEGAPFEGRTLGDAELLAGISQRVPLGGRLGAAREAGLLEAERLRREHELRRIEVRSRVQAAFATARFAEETARVHAELLALARRGAELAELGRREGDVPADEAARAGLEEARARLEEDKVNGLRDLAFVTLAGALGEPSLRIGSLHGSLESVFELPALDSVLAALEDGPQAALARGEVEAARARLEQAGAERIPDVTLDLLYRRIGITGADTFDVGISIPLPVFDRGQGRMQEARAGLREAEARARGTRDDAVRRVREAHARLSEALSHRRLVKEAILPKAEAILAAAELRHAAGDLGLGETLRVRREHAEARLAHLEALREVMEAWGDLRGFLPR